MTARSNHSTGPVVEVRGLDFSYDQEPDRALSDVDLVLYASDRCLLVGPNGAGKTTLLRILAGKHMVPPDRALVMGRPVFADTALAAQVGFLSETVPSAVDLPVSDMIRHARERWSREGAHRAADADILQTRLERLSELLGIEPTWRLHHLSRGQRRRVYLFLGLLEPRSLLLLDEVAADLDIMARYRLLDFLREESEGRGTAVLYATHILDGLTDWATKVLVLKGGRVRLFAALDEIPGYLALRRSGHPDPLGRALLSLMLDSEYRSSRLPPSPR